MRFKPLARVDLNEDVAWKTAMPSGYRRLSRASAGPFAGDMAIQTRPARQRAFE